MTEQQRRADLIDSSPELDPAGRPARTSQRGQGRWIVAGIAAVAMLALIGALAWSLLGGGNDDDPGLLFIIPEGSKARVVPELESAVRIPTDIRFGPGDTAKITIVNEDDVTHRAGPFLVGPNQTYTQRFPEPGEYPIACSVDPAESVVVTVTA